MVIEFIGEFILWLGLLESYSISNMKQYLVLDSPVCFVCAFAIYVSCCSIFAIYFLVQYLSNTLQSFIFVIIFIDT